MKESEIIWIAMTVMSLLFGVLILLVIADEESIRRASRVSPLAGLFRHKWLRYATACVLFCLSVVSFALFKGWIE